MALSRFFLSHARSLNRSAFDQIMPLLKKKDFSAIARGALSGVEKRDIQLLSQPSTDFQTLMTTMDTSRSYITVLGVDVVDAEPAQTQLSTGGDKAEAVAATTLNYSFEFLPG
jgi:hypothetical protein